MILSKLSVDQFSKLLVEASDYEIKRRNYQQERIFSYDKPNKYRSDINNIIYCLLNNHQLISSKPNDISNAVERAMEVQKLDWREEGHCIKKYVNDIVTRNEVIII
jgi:hypothetical protein